MTRVARKSLILYSHIVTVNDWKRIPQLWSCSDTRYTLDTRLIYIAWKTLHFSDLYVRFNWFLDICRRRGSLLSCIWLWSIHGEQIISWAIVFTSYVLPIVLLRNSYRHSSTVMQWNSTITEHFSVRYSMMSLTLGDSDERRSFWQIEV